MGRNARKKVRQLQRRERTLLREKKRVDKFYTKKINNAQKKIDQLKLYQTIVEISNELEPSLPDYSVNELPKEKSKRLIDLYLKSITVEDSNKIGAARLQEELSQKRNPFLVTIKFYDDYSTFVEENKIQLWLSFCVFVHALKSKSKKTVEELWTSEGLEIEYTRRVIKFWTLLGWKQRGRAFKFTSLITNTFRMADVPVLAGFLEPPFQFMVLEPPPVFFLPTKNRSNSPISDILVGFLPPTEDEDKRLTVILTSSHRPVPQVIFSISFDEALTIQQNIESFCALEGTKEKEAGLARTVLNFICNAILYCTSFPDDIEANNACKLAKLEKRLQRAQGEKRKDATRKLAKVRNDTIYIIGKNFKLDDKKVSEELGQDKRNINTKYIVRGHWRNQACGPKHSERKLIFIQPFWKGTGKEPFKKKYLVK